MIERLRRYLGYRYGARIALWFVRFSTWPARRKLAKIGPLQILVDNTVLGHSITHETAWISTGPELWGDQMVDTGYAARVGVHSAGLATRERKNVEYLPGLVSLTKSGHIRLHTSAELSAERFRKPIGMFQGYGYFDLNLFSQVPLESIDGIVLPSFGASWMDTPTEVDQQRERLLRHERADPEYASLVAVLGRKNSQDAWHIRTAEKHGLFCFLTMDFKLIDTLEGQKGASRIKSLGTKVMTPHQLGSYMELHPIAVDLLSYIGASFFVRGDLSWPDGKRRRRKRKPRA